MPKENQEKTILSKNLFPVVGIGASAGGLEAFKKFIKAITPDSGMAYIVVQHLHPEHESSLPEILQKSTKIPVLEISDNVHVEPDYIYVIPSNKMLVANDGVLQLSPRLNNKLNLAIDIFFSSLGEIHQSHAIGVVLSGMGADGTKGLKDIQDNGGLTFAQEPNSAAYADMPQHAIDAEIVDFVLVPEEMPAKLLELKKSLDLPALAEEPKLEDIENEDFQEILDLVKADLGVDFKLYKQTTVKRRIIRRLTALHIEKPSQYAEYISNNKAECRILFNDMLIPVTSFFRDPATFEALSEKLFLKIEESKSSKRPVRIWVAGCSTGQEAYSMAICLMEQLGESGLGVKLQIFATDLSEKSIQKARSGIYTAKELEGSSETRLNRFFIKKGNKYQVNKNIREICIFAVHNLLLDPPFAKMDLISCRNVLIYFQSFLQKKVLGMFHYSLNEKGLLWLGKSETIGNLSDLYGSIDKKHKLYVKQSVPGKLNSVFDASGSVTSDKKIVDTNKTVKTADFDKSANDILLAKYTPVGVIVNEQFDIVQFRGLTGEYLEPSPGKASLNILKMAKDGLSFEIRNALHKAKTTKQTVVQVNIPVNNCNTMVTIEVVPLLDTLDVYYLVLFKNDPVVNTVMNKANDAKSTSQSLADKLRILHLEKELARIRDDMRSVTEEQEAANEELQSSNEELLSGSEELQSLNEELETSKEELQSTNEELITVNQELDDRNRIVDQSRKFAETTFSILHEPLLILDTNFRVTSANASFYKKFLLTEKETLGNTLFNLQDNGWEIPGLRTALENIQRNQERMLELETWFTFPIIGLRSICFNIQPINRENGEQLFLLAIDDNSLVKNKAQEQKTFNQELENQLEERKKLEKQKNEFINMASHELKTPVTSIKGYTQVLQRKFKNDGNELAESFMTKMDKQINKLSSLISDLLDSTKVTTGQLVYRESTFDLNELTGEIVEEMQLTSKTHVIHLQLSDPARIFGDRNRIGQVITNLLSNAIKYSPRANRIDVNLVHAENVVHLFVRDHGIGIPLESQARIFEQSYRVSGLVQETFAGLGLGLFIAAEIIKKHNGSISVKSEEGEGSTFCMTMPCCEPHVQKI